MTVSFSRRRSLLFFGTLLLTTCSISLVSGWGFWAHHRINRAAVFALPESMRPFFYNHIDFITEEAAIPDVRIYSINYRQEANRHYVDLEDFKMATGDTLPRTMKEVVARYGDSVVQKAGLLPWYIEEITTKLTKAFRDRNKSYILFLAGDLAHYIGDAHVPLHTTSDHDGRTPAQKGIHALWESQLTEKFGDAYNLHTRDAVYIQDVRKEIWRIINSSHALVDSVLTTEANLMKSFPADRIYQTDSAGKVMRNQYNETKHSLEYARKYHEALNGMVERQMRLSITAVSDFWYTAWVDAGKPDLAPLDPASLTKRNGRFYKKDYNLWKKGRIAGLKSGNDF